MSKFYEDFIVEDTTPLAFALAEKMSRDNESFSKLPPEERGLQEIVDHLIEQNRDLLKSFGRLEQAINQNAKKVITA